MDAPLERNRHRARRRLGALAPAARLGGDHACRAGRRARRGRADLELVRGRRAPHRADHASATRSPSAGWDQFVDGVEDALPLPHDPLLAGDKLARFDRADDRGAHRRARPRRGGARRALGRARVARARASGRRGRGRGAPLARALGRQPRAHAADRGRITFLDGTQSLVQAIWTKAPYETRLSTPVACGLAGGRPRRGAHAGGRDDPCAGRSSWPCR